MGRCFFKHGLGLKKKYHMVKWDTLMTPKDFGGLGFTNTRVMNECILEKWIFKRERGDENVCFNLLRKKYLGNKGFFSCNTSSDNDFYDEDEYSLVEALEC